MIILKKQTTNTSANNLNKSNSSNKILITIMLLLVVCGFAHSAHIPVRNFHKSDYEAGAQNWSFAQDSIGKVYFGNANAMLSYDGQRWRRHYLPNYTTVRSVVYDDATRRIYAGGSGEFGYFYNEPDNGYLTYKSLLGEFKTQRPAFSEIWNIHIAGDNIYFQGDNHLFIYNKNGIRALKSPDRISTSALIWGNLYIATEKGHIFNLNSGNLVALKGLELLHGKKIVAIEPWKEGCLLLGTSTDGLYLYDFNSIKSMTGELNEFLKSNQLFSAVENDGEYLFGTVTGGAVNLHKDGSTDYIDKTTGLQNPTVLRASFDREGNIWLCLDNGIDYAVARTQAKSLFGSDNPIGTGYASYFNGNRLLLGTNQGLFSTDYHIGDALTGESMHRDLQGQVWSITPSSHGVFVATDAGIYTFDGDKYTHIEGVGGSYKVMPWPGDPEHAIASAYDAFHLLTYGSGIWKDAGAVRGTEQLRGQFLIDRYGYVWLPDWKTGIYKLKFDFSKGTLTSKTLYNHESGLPTDRNNSVAKLGGGIVFSTEGGFYKPSATDSESVERVEELNRLFSMPAFGMLQNLNENNFVLFDERGMTSIRGNKDSRLEVKNYSGPLIYRNLVPGFSSVSELGDGMLLLSTQDGFVEISQYANAPQRPSKKPYISLIFNNRDSLLYSSSVHEDRNTRLTLPYSENSLRFEIAYPQYSLNNALSYSSYMENYDKEWTPYTQESTREYTRLGPGSYVLHVKVRDDSTGEETDTNFRFKILPPWYLTIWAKIFYVIIGLIIVGAIIYFVRLKFESAQRRIAQSKEDEMQQLRIATEKETLQKDYEIANLKAESLEQEISHKSRELSATAMNLIRKNEILREIGAQIDKISADQVEGSSHQTLKKSLKKIQATIKASIEKTDELEEFTRNFDIVYQDFTKTLHELHPTLTQSDIRLCCYIRMGLASKEIAPLVNISSKSVEMARYRLRKKLGIDADASLYSYLHDLRGKN